VSSASLSGFVTDALDGRPLTGITVEIPGLAAVTTGTDGAFILETGASGEVPLVFRGDGFHTRESHALLSSLRMQVDILPLDRGFDLDFFDHVFRNLGADYTSRWTEEPRFESGRESTNEWKGTSTSIFWPLETRPRSGSSTSRAT
jgi:hypothetical protein